jgi:hypothetical protein
MLPGETLQSGAPSSCKDCGETFVAKVLQSAAGYYVGTECRCGPNSRELGYCPSAEAAAELLRLGTYSRNPAKPATPVAADDVLVLLIVR